VASFPPNTPATEIATKAREKGLTMSEKFIYNLRNGKGRPAAPARGAAKPVVASAPRAPAAGASPYEAVFARAVVELGFDHAQALLSRVRDRLLSAAQS
jgi:hypothetical protein